MVADNRTQIRITAKDETRAAIQSAKDGLGSLVAGAARLPLIGAALAGAFSGVAITAGIKSVLEGADQLAKASQKYGIAVEQLSALSYAGKLADVSLEAIGNGLKKLSVNMLDTAAGTGEAKEAFKALGIEVKTSDGVLKSSDAVLGEIADKFAGMEDGAGKTALAVRLFGRAGADMIPLLNAGSKGLAEMREEAERFGAVIGGDLARKSEEFNDNLTRLGVAFDAFKIGIAQKALPALSKFLEQLVAGIRIAGGFWEAITPKYGLVNPFNSHAENLRAWGDELEQIERRLAFAIPEAERKSLDASADALRKRIAYTKELAQIEARSLIGPQFLDARDLSLSPAAKAKAPGLANESALKKAAADAKKAAEEAAKAFEEANKAIYEQALAAAEADAEIQKLRNSYTDMAEPAAKTMRELQKFEELAPALGLSAEAVERIRDAFNEKINVEQYGKPLKEITKEVKKQDDLAKDLGLTFQSAFEDAVIAGKKFSDVLKGLAQDIARIVLRKTVTEPLGNAISSLLKDNLPSFGGGRASGGPVSPGQYYVVGENGPEVLLPNTAGTVVPSGAMGGSQVTVNIINQTPAQVSTRESMVDGRRQIEVLVRDTVSTLMSGGALDGVMRANFGAGRAGVLRG